MTPPAVSYWAPAAAVEVARLEQRARDNALDGAPHDVALLDTEIEHLVGGLRAAL